MRGRARRLRGLLLAVLLCASQVGAWVHEAVVAHVTCVEHGESLHAGRAGAGPSREAPAAPDGLARAGAETAARASAHEHCGGGALLRARDVAVPAPLATGELTPPAIPPTAHERALDATCGAGVYLLAPKTSPPAARA